MKNPEMLKFVPDYLKTNKMCNHAVKKLPCLLRYVLDQYNTQQMCNSYFRKWCNIKVCSWLLQESRKL